MHGQSRTDERSGTGPVCGVPGPARRHAQRRQAAPDPGPARAERRAGRHRVHAGRGALGRRPAAQFRHHAADLRSPPAEPAGGSRAGRHKPGSSSARGTPATCSKRVAARRMSRTSTGSPASAGRPRSRETQWAASDLLGQALALWRGSALADVPLGIGFWTSRRPRWRQPGSASSSAASRPISPFAGTPTSWAS